MELAHQYNPENACIFAAKAELELRDILMVLGFGGVNKKYLIEAVKRLNKRSLADRSFGQSQLNHYVAELKTMFSQIFKSCTGQGTTGLGKLQEIDHDYFGEGFKENFMTCVNDESLSKALESIATTWYKLKYSGEMLDYLIQVIVWYGRISDEQYMDTWDNVSEVYLDRVESLKNAMAKCGVRS